MIKKLIEKAKYTYRHSSLVAKIRYSYIILLIPLMILLIFSMFNVWESNRRYADMINSISVASDFSLDFKKDFDYETYLLIVGNKKPEESDLTSMLNQAKWVLERLEQYSYDSDNEARLQSVRKYLGNLSTYSQRIEENLKSANTYEENLEIWENDVQIVTSLIRETFFQFIYYETQDIQVEREEFNRKATSVLVFTFMAFFTITIILIYLSYRIPLDITKPIIELSNVTNQVANGNLSVRSKVYDGVEASMLSDSLNAMIDKINELLSQVTTEQIRLRKAEFELLQSQINPHFLYNTLDAIVWLAESGDQKQVVKMVGWLSDFFRTSLNQGKDVVTIKEELQHVRSYLEIQQVRYQDILKFEIKVPESLENYYIPKITLQPIVENALYHGIKNKRGLGCITIDGIENGEDFVISVKDDGIGMTEERLEKVSYEITHMESDEKVVYGLYNINERIRLNFSDKYGISIESKYGEGTCVEVLLPKQS